MWLESLLTLKFYNSSACQVLTSCISTNNKYQGGLGHNFLNLRFQVIAAAAESLQSCLTLCNPMDCSLPGSSFHRILQARILEWVAMPSSRGSSQPMDWTRASCIAGGLFTIWATREGADFKIIFLILIFFN